MIDIFFKIYNRSQRSWQSKKKPSDQKIVHPGHSRKKIEGKDLTLYSAVKKKKLVEKSDKNSDITAAKV
ncbi:hypothetical protein PIROE2DRAFT_11378 [Piromyces sp. E2]|nr:hypothetical protein PIROE2DRAFT_11378 [Piromyces sp. E2]|eukprot:OUM62373.1 hypothetical protein PIROE2DRAFT_11378 [Piromyces sp. E2]